MNGNYFYILALCQGRDIHIGRKCEIGNFQTQMTVEPFEMDSKNCLNIKVWHMCDYSSENGEQEYVLIHKGILRTVRNMFMH